MRKLEIKKAWIRRAHERAVLRQEDAAKVEHLIQSTKGEATVDLAVTDYPNEFWRAILDEANLTPNVRAALSLHVFGMKQGDCSLDEMYDMEVSSPVEFGTALQLSVGSPNCEFRVNGRWYPVILASEFVEDREKVAHAVRLQTRLVLGERSFDVSSFVARDVFLDQSGQRLQKTVLDVLESFGYRRLQTSAADFNLRLVRAERASTESGKVCSVKNSVVVANRFSWWQGFEVRALGTADMPSRCVIESALEADEDARHVYSGYGHQSDAQSPLPFVRLFCLETKEYVYADVDDVDEYEFDTGALDRLHLPPDMHSILSRVFATPIENMFGDILKGKHGGVVVLASGSPGVGKTLTAEIYAETTERPLYVLELGELGTKADEVEQNLQRVFARVTRWNAVLQFDECEIFLAKRGTDLERSAIVGIFLRLLDYYRGLLFLTTNRPDALDDAVLSRIMLRLSYPDLDSGTRASVWQSMFEIAGLEPLDLTFAELGEYELNGRQIRNLTRLAKILNPDGRVSAVDFQEVLTFGQPTSDGEAVAADD